MMHTLVEVPVGTNGGTHVPAFLAKLWKIIDDPSTNDLIGWSEMSNSFIIKNQAKFARDLLPLYYKHNNMASFVRQLNMYGFHKVVSVEQGGLRVDKDEMEFAHPFFLKGQEASLELIKRKIPASKHEESRVRPDSLNKVLIDVRQMKGRQESMDNKLVTMKRENEALWRELASLRQKHAKQTQIVSKLLQFLVGMMSQQTPRLAFKRRLPLMLNDKDGVKQKLSRTNTNELTGPVIHDVTELLESDEPGETLDEQGCVSNTSVMEPSGNDLSRAPSRSPYSESVGEGRISPESPAMLFPVDPALLNPSMGVPATNFLQMRQNAESNKQQVKSKAKSALKRNSGPTFSLSSVKSEAGVGFPNAQAQHAIPSSNIVQSQSQIGQTPGLLSVPPSSQTQNSVPTTLYFTAPGMAEPVQVLLSIPDQNCVTTTTASGTNSITPSVAASTSSVSGKTYNVPQQQEQYFEIPSTKTATTTGGTDATMGRSQTVNPKILMKSNGSKPPGDLDGHLDDMEVGLNNLRDLFKSNEYPVDEDTLIGVSRSFNLAAIDPETYAQLFNGSSADNAENQGNQNQQYQMAATGAGGDVGLLGQELVAYNPSLFELAEDDNSNFFDESSNIFLDDELESMLTTDRESLKRTDGHGPGRNLSRLSFSGVNLGTSLDAGLHTPVVCEPASIPSTSTGAGKRKRK